METADSLLSRIAIIHLVAEARGVDMNPLTLAKLRLAKDEESAAVLEVIHADEITRESSCQRTNGAKAVLVPSVLVSTCVVLSRRVGAS